MKLARILSSVAFAFIIATFIGPLAGVSPLLIGAPLSAFGVMGATGIIPMPESSFMLNFGAIANITTPDVDGRESMGGYTSVAYLAFISDIETFPTEPDIESVTDTKDLAKLVGSFTMKVDKYFYKVRVKPYMSQFNPESQGNVGGRSFRLNGSIYIPGIDDESAGLARMLKSKFAVLILPDPDGKHRICVGTEQLPCEFTPTGASGQVAADDKGFTFNFACDSFAPGWLYEGSIPLSGSTISGVS